VTDRIPGHPGWHSGYELSYFESGCAEYRINNKNLMVPTGSVVLVPAFMEHQSDIQGELAARTCWIDAAVVKELAKLFSAHQPSWDINQPEILTSPSSKLINMMQMIIEEAQGDGFAQNLVLHALTEAMVIEILRHKSPPRSELANFRSPQINTVLDYIETCFTEPITIEDLARIAGMSRFHFSRCFKDETGQSPYQYLLNKRINQAAVLLRGKRCNITEAALSVGLNDIGRFSRLFRKKYGCSPSQYRRDGI